VTKKPKITGRTIPTTNEIVMFWHCMNCFHHRPEGTAPADWVRLEGGWTELGFQLRCQRCDLNIIHVDFEGMQHPANLGGGKKTTTQ
jgi:hypothetical protein